MRDLTVDIWPHDTASTWEPFAFSSITARDAFATQALAYLTGPRIVGADTKVWEMTLA